MDLNHTKATLEKAGVRFAPGLTKTKLDEAEKAYGFQFPPDLREFLAFALPISEKWPDWRNLEDAGIRAQMGWPLEGMCFDIENNTFWLESWGHKPASLREAFAIAKQKVGTAPRLIPVFGHRYMPDRPNSRGNPVFSVYQTDIIHYGGNLQNYLENEFYDYFQTRKYQLPDGIRKIDFWSDLCS